MDKPSLSLRTATGFTLAVLIVQPLAGCSGSQSLPPGGALSPAALRPPSLAVSADTRGASKSWISPNAKSASQLLYVSTGIGATVNIYSWPSQSFLGTIGGLVDPTGVCADKKGDVYVTDYETDAIAEYPHGGVVPIAKLSDSYGAPYDCAFDTKTGDLAVTTLTDNSGIGNVLVFKHARGTPTAYTVANIDQYDFAAYDPSGNLFVDGLPNQGQLGLAELPFGASSLKPLTLSVKIDAAGGLHWDGKYLAAGDQYQNVIDQFTISGTSATFEGYTDLGGADQIFDFCVTGGTKNAQGDELVASSYGNSVVGVWNYPAGGQLTSSITGIGEPLGVVISQK